MKRLEVLKTIEEVASLPTGSLKGDEQLSTLFGWDSLSGVVFRAAVKDRWRVALSGVALARCETVADIVKSLGSHVEDR